MNYTNNVLLGILDVEWLCFDSYGCVLVLCFYNIFTFIKLKIIL